MCTLVVHTLICDGCGHERSLRSSLSELEDMKKAIRIDAITDGWFVSERGNVVRCPKCG